jgi:hypothetical protein
LNAYGDQRCSACGEGRWMAVGPLKVLREAVELPAGGSRRMSKTTKPTNHLRLPDGRAFILPSAVGTSAPRRSLTLSSEPAICTFEACGGVRAGASSEAGPRVTRGTGGGLPLTRNFLDPARKPRAILKFL